MICLHKDVPASKYRDQFRPSDLKAPTISSSVQFSIALNMFARSRFSLEPTYTPCPNDRGVARRFPTPGVGPGALMVRIGGGSGSKLCAPGFGSEPLQIVPCSQRVTQRRQISLR